MDHYPKSESKLDTITEEYGIQDERIGHEHNSLIYGLIELGAKRVEK